MNQFKEQALDYINRKDFDGLQKFLITTPQEHQKFADEVRLLSLVEQGASNEKLERPLDNYISKYNGEVPISNIVTAARLKFELGKMEEALELLSRHDVPRDDIEASEIAVLCLFNLKRYAPGKALVHYLLEVNSENAQYHEWNILFSYKEHDLETVISSWEAFIKLEGSFTQRVGVLGFVIRAYMFFGRLKDAQAVYDDYELENDIENIDAAMFIADFEKQKGNFEKCKEILRSMKSKHPDIAEIRWNLALCQLASGELSDGWCNYESRWEWADFTSPKRSFDAPRWDGLTGLDGRSLLIWGEQGIGDQLRFLTLLPNFLDSNPGVRVTLEVDERLIKLVRTWYPEVDEVWAMGIDDTRGVADYALFDYQIPSGSLPAIYFNDSAALSSSKYRVMKVSPDKKNSLFGAFAADYTTLVGVSWRSMLLSQGRIHDYVNAEGFRSIIEAAPEGTGFVILQYAITESERQIFAGLNNVYLPSQDFLNEVDLNAVYAGACDLLVSCGTVVATMAGIFGIPVVSWCKFDDPVNLGQEHNPWFPNRFDIRVQPNWDKVVLIDKLSQILNSYLSRRMSKGEPSHEI